MPDTTASFHALQIHVLGAEVLHPDTLASRAYVADFQYPPAVAANLAALRDDLLPTVLDLRHEHQRYLNAHPERIYFDQHSLAVRSDAVAAAPELVIEHEIDRMGDKWGDIMGSLIPATQEQLARWHHTPHANGFFLVGNTQRVIEGAFHCFDVREGVHIVTTDSEFDSAARQIAAFEQKFPPKLTPESRDRLVPGVTVDRISSEPFESLRQRLVDAVRKVPTNTLVVFSSTFYNSGYVVQDANEIATEICKANPNAIVVIDDYHSGGVVPLNYDGLPSRCLRTGGMYKYHSAGEGAGYIYVPPGFPFSPSTTGWMAGGVHFESGGGYNLTYPEGGARFAGATFDPTVWARTAASFSMRERNAITPESSAAHFLALKRYMLAHLEYGGPVGTLRKEDILLADTPERSGGFLVLHLADEAKANALVAGLRALDIWSDQRRGNVRLGFGVTTSLDDIDRAFARMRSNVWHLS